MSNFRQNITTIQQRRVRLHAAGRWVCRCTMRSLLRRRTHAIDIAMLAALNIAMSITGLKTPMSHVDQAGSYRID